MPSNAYLHFKRAALTPILLSMPLAVASLADETVFDARTIAQLIDPPAASRGQTVANPLPAPPATRVALEEIPHAGPVDGDIDSCHCGSSCGPPRYSRQSRLSAYWHTRFKPQMQARAWGYPEYFCERPFGTCNIAANQFMISNGLRDQLVLYAYDFGHGEDAAWLSPRGVYQLEKMAKRMAFAFAPIVIEAVPDDPELNAQRHENVLATLAEIGVTPEPEMVVVGRPRVRGLDGVEALPIYGNLLEQTRLRGNVGVETSALEDIGFGSEAIGVISPQAAGMQPQ